MLLWMLQTETSHLWKVRYAIILLGWRYVSYVIRITGIDLISHSNMQITQGECCKSYDYNNNMILSD